MLDNTARTPLFTAEELAELALLVNTATEGPWVWEDWGKDPMYPERSRVHMVLTAPPPNPEDTIFPELRTPLFELYGGEPGDVTAEDMALIALARRDIPRLLSHIAEQARLLVLAGEWSDAVWSSEPNIFIKAGKSGVFREALVKYRKETRGMKEAKENE